MAARRRQRQPLVGPGLFFLLLQLALLLVLALPTALAVTFAPDVAALVAVLQLCTYRTPRLLPYDPCGHSPLLPAWPG